MNLHTASCNALFIQFFHTLGMIFRGRLSLCQEIIISECAEVIGCRSSSAERLAVTDLLDVSKAAGYAFISVGVKCVKIE